MVGQDNVVGSGSRHGISKRGERTATDLLYRTKHGLSWIFGIWFLTHREFVGKSVVYSVSAQNILFGQSIEGTKRVQLSSVSRANQGLLWVQRDKKGAWAFVSLGAWGVWL